MIEAQININSFKELDNYISKVDLSTFNNKDFLDFLKKKSMEALDQTINERLKGGTNNDEEISLYINSNHIVDTADGFLMYNDAKIPADKYNTIPFDTSGYPGGMFSVALAFEYGVGVSGKSEYGVKHGYVYNNLSKTKSSGHKRLQTEWYLPKMVYGKSGMKTSGYQGFEIYRFTAEKIKRNLNNWIKEYQKRGNK